MNPNKVFAIFKAKEKKNEKSPDYNISMKVGDKYENIGGCWIKEGKSGKFFSCKLNGPYQQRKGYEITESKSVMSQAITPENYPQSIDPNEIPF
jgi:uncharacterized protein (DUF736 family)